MNIAYLVTGTPHGHCYGADHLYAGLCAEYGFAHVFDWPEKDNLHLPSIEARDACSIDADQTWPRKHHGWDAVAACDLAIIATHPDAPDATAIAAACSRLPRSMPIAALDASDKVEDCSAWYAAVAGRPLAAYFKREYPIGAQWPGTFACPLSYPASRVPELRWPAKHGVFYHATDHGGGAPGVPRQAIATGLIECVTRDRVREVTALREADSGAVRAIIDGGLDICLMPSQELRLSPERYHERMGKALIGISWNGARNFDCNRYWENFAYGLCQVVETPRIQIPKPPLDGIDCFYVNTPDAVAPLVWSLLHDETRARAVAQNGHAHFLKHHSSEARARYVIDTLERVG